jgi:hypothetical protein
MLVVVESTDSGHGISTPHGSTINGAFVNLRKASLLLVIVSLPSKVPPPSRAAAGQPSRTAATRLKARSCRAKQNLCRALSQPHASQICSASHEGEAMNATESTAALLSDIERSMQQRGKSLRSMTAWDFLAGVAETAQLAVDIDAAQGQLAAAKQQLEEFRRASGLELMQLCVRAGIDRLTIQEMHQQIERALAAAGAPAASS